jgi:hypothetical protein
MGLQFSKNVETVENNSVNYSCPECQKTGKLPNLSGRFFIINDTQCQCNGCGTKYPKSQIYKDASECN